MSLSVGWSVGHSYCQLASVQDGKFVTLAVGKINSWSTSKLIKKNCILLDQAIFYSASQPDNWSDCKGLDLLRNNGAKPMQKCLPTFFSSTKFNVDILNSYAH